MSPDVADAGIAERIRGAFPDAVLGTFDFGRDQLWIDVSVERIHDVLRFLRDEETVAFRYLVDLTCVDYLKMPDYARERFGVTYILHSHLLDRRAYLKCFVPEARPEVASASDLFGAANWAEREVFDLYGIRFAGHPDLRRILLPDDYEGHPLRKDYPLKGRGERDSFRVVTRREG